MGHPLPHVRPHSHTDPRKALALTTRNILLATTLAATTILAAGTPATAAPDTHRDPPAMSFSQRAADWWTWALTAPTSTNTATDITGANCAVGQRQTGPWYLAGAIFPQSPITRSCTVPEDRDLFFPVINLAYFAFLNDPADTRTIDFVRAQVACETGSTGTVTLDGKPLPKAARVHEQSVVFSVQLPDANIFGLTPELASGLVLSPSVDQGTYVLLHDLRKGHHTIHIQSALSPSCRFQQTNDVTYQLTVH